MTRPLGPVSSPIQERADHKLSLRGLFALVTLAAMVLGLRPWLSPAAFAGLAGLAVLCYLNLRWQFDLRGAAYILAAWILVLIHILAVVLALYPLSY